VEVIIQGGSHDWPKSFSHRNFLYSHCPICCSALNVSCPTNTEVHHLACKVSTSNPFDFPDHYFYFKNNHNRAAFPPNMLNNHVIHPTRPCIYMHITRSGGYITNCTYTLCMLHHWGTSNNYPNNAWASTIIQYGG